MVMPGMQVGFVSEKFRFVVMSDFIFMVMVVMDLFCFMIVVSVGASGALAAVSRPAG